MRTARAVVNATGVFCDGVRRMGEPNAASMVSPSQGIHLVFDRSFLPGDTAFVVPKTPDGRVMFAIPWHGHTLVGTTDVAVPDAPLEPRPTEQEIAFVLETAGRYLAKPPTRSGLTWKTPTTSKRRASSEPWPSMSRPRRSAPPSKNLPASTKRATPCI